MYEGYVAETSAKHSVLSLSGSTASRCQVLADAFMVLLVRQKGLPEGIHNDLSRVPPFICTALVHVLRASLLLSIHEVRK